MIDNYYFCFDIYAIYGIYDIYAIYPFGDLVTKKVINVRFLKAMSVSVWQPGSHWKAAPGQCLFGQSATIMPSGFTQGNKAMIYIISGNFHFSRSKKSSFLTGRRSPRLKVPWTRELERRWTARQVEPGGEGGVEEWGEGRDFYQQEDCDFDHFCI